jgi:tRNA threonylcarbamoyladenosine biosynthesis protein TsaB
MVPPMNLLIFDTSQGMTSLALWRRGECIANEHSHIPNTQAAALIPQIQRLLHTHEMQFEALNGIGCITGTGGFTSVRIGVATARGLGFAAGISVWGVSLPEIMAWWACNHAGVQGHVTCVLSAGNRDFTLQTFMIGNGKHPTALTALQLIAKDALPHAGHSFCAPEGTLASDIPHLSFPVPDAAMMLGEWICAATPEHLARALSPAPLYAKCADAIAAAPLLAS